MNEENATFSAKIVVHTLIEKSKEELRDIKSADETIKRRNVKFMATTANTIQRS